MRWKENVVRLGISDSLTTASNIKFGSDVRGVIERSIAAWKAVASIEIVTVPSERDSVSPAGQSGDGVSVLTIAGTNENVLFFSGGFDSLSGKTRVFYNGRGQITEADIVLNPFVQFSTDGSYGTFDLETTIRHEIGHLLGLGHSPIAGATMYEGVNRNHAFRTLELDRSLSADDISAIRALYGANREAEGCCASVSGKLNFSGKAHRDITVWLQEKTTGAVVAFTKLGRNRTFKLDGIEYGSYDLFASESLAGRATAAQALGSVRASEGKAVTVTHRFQRKPVDFEIRYIGDNGLLSDSPVTLQKGTRRLLMIGGKDLDSVGLRFAVDSPFIEIDDASTSTVDYAEAVTARTFTVTVDPDTPTGNYSVYAMSPNGDRHYFLGSISVIP